MEQLIALKRLLCCESTFLKKNKQKGISINPHCQVVFISNQSPDSFPFIASDSTFCDKIIPFQFSEVEIIPFHLQTANLSLLADAYLVDLFNWVIYSPLEVLDQMVSAKTLC